MGKSFEWNESSTCKTKVIWLNLNTKNYFIQKIYRPITNTEFVPTLVKVSHLVHLIFLLGSFNVGENRRQNKPLLLCTTGKGK
jgi:hypothetical protein